MLEDVQRRRLALPGRGVEIALLDWGGEGPLALLHHANGFCAATLDLVARPLRAHYRVIGMDARGHGDSSTPVGEGAFGWSEFGADVAAVARQLAAEHGGRVALGLGHSFGGTSILLAASMEPSLFERIVGVDPVLHPPRPAAELDPRRSERGAELIDRASKRRSVFPDRDAAAANWREKPLFATWDARAFALYLDEGMRDRPDGRVELKCAPITEAAVFSGGGLTDVWAPTKGLAVPVRLLWATHGDFPRAVYEGFVAQLGAGEIVDVEGRHLIPMEDPDTVVRETLAFADPGRRGVDR
jgi:pimeloyl-ACP methyl ester carboxylesterase